VPFSPQYNPPTLATMRTLVARTLRDTSASPVFSTDALNDFITEGLMNVSGYRPIESSEGHVYDPATPGSVSSFTLVTLSYVSAVGIVNGADPVSPDQNMFLPYNGDMGGNGNLRGAGWELWQGTVSFSNWAVNNLDAWHGQVGGPLTVIILGYRDRTIPDSDDDILDLEDVTDQLCLTRECRALGFQALNNDRALYQQWLAATNNTDVSPTQLGGMLNGAISDVERQRKRNAIIRRVPLTGF
jgi:hypothetical protein